MKQKRRKEEIKTEKKAAITGKHEL